MKMTRGRLRKQFIEATKEPILMRDLCKKTGRTQTQTYGLIYAMRNEGHEIWMINKTGGYDCHYQHIKGPSVVGDTFDDVEMIIKNDHYTVPELAELLGKDPSTIRKVLDHLKKEYHFDIDKVDGLLSYKIIKKKSDEA